MTSSPLVADVSARLVSGKFAGNLSAFCGLLRCYQMDPAAADSALVARVLMATLPRFATSECTACLCLIPERQHDAPELKPIVDLDDLLERGDFAAFWQAYGAGKDSLPQIAGFEDAMRQAIAETLSLSFGTVDAAAAARMLNVAKPSDAVACFASGVAKLEGEQIAFAANEFNRPKPPPEPRDLSSGNIASLVRGGTQARQ